MFVVFFIDFFLDVFADGTGQFFIVDFDAVVVVEIGVQPRLGVVLLQNAFNRRQPRRLGIGRYIDLQGFVVGDFAGGGVRVVQHQLETLVVQTVLRVGQFSDDISVT